MEIIEAIKDGNVDLVLSLLESQYSTKDKDGKNIFQIAIESGKTEVVRILIKFTNENMSEEDNFLEEESPFCEVDCGDWCSEEPISTAVRVGEYEIVKLLVDAGVDFIVFNSNEETPLDIAVKEFNELIDEEIKSQYHEIIDLLLNAIKEKVEKSRTHIECYEFTLDYIGSSLHTVLCKAIISSNIKIFNTIMSLDVVDLDKKYKYEMTLLHLAVRKYEFEFAEKLIYAGANLDAQDACKNTPLHFAATHKSNDMWNLLIDNEADEDITNVWGNTPIETSNEFIRVNHFDFMGSYVYDSVYFDYADVY